ncbi:TCR/Tet family MFS transporter [Terriglobus aquaticus]|uniref:TCR/Tet family MFS transporter n=1 Tax=Terriglobus aquaticus TaxID=940139 RepID=A0ABW9KMY7_9BACT|nr:TCR/Tet family MFS transporter [Terriglobus aquaticus]
MSDLQDDLAAGANPPSHRAEDDTSSRGVGDPTDFPASDDAPSPVHVQPARRAAVTFIFLTVTLDMLALGMIAPVLPDLISGFVGGSAARTAETIGLFGTVFALMQYVFSPVLGSLSDRYGRRPVVLLSNFGLGLDYILMALAPSLRFLLIGRVLAGITASSVPTAQAYMSDVTPREKRAAAFGMLQAAFGFGFIVGPALGGWLGSISPRLPFWVSAALSLLNFVYGLFVLPESLAMQYRSPFSWKRANPIGSIRLLSRSRNLLALSGVLLLGYLAQNSLLNVYVVYVEYRYHWSVHQIGNSLAVLGGLTILYGFFLVRRASQRLGDQRATVYGLAGGGLGYIIFGAAHTGLQFVAGMPLLNLTSIAWPATQSIMSRAIGPNEQGQLQGAINSLRGIAGIAGPSLFTWIFARAISNGSGFHMPGLPYYTAAGFMLLSVLLGIVTGREPKQA